MLRRDRSEGCCVSCHTRGRGFIGGLRRSVCGDGDGGVELKKMRIPKLLAYWLRHDVSLPQGCNQNKTGYTLGFVFPLLGYWRRMERRRGVGGQGWLGGVPPATWTCEDGRCPYIAPTVVVVSGHSDDEAVPCVAAPRIRCAALIAVSCNIFFVSAFCSAWFHVVLPNCLREERGEVH